MTTSQFFVYRRPVAWTALVATLAWGVFAYLRMPQRQDPIIPVRSGVVLTSYPGARAEKVEQEVTRKVEKRVSEHPDVEKVTSISRQGLSVVFVELYDRTRDADPVWLDIQEKLRDMPDLPSLNGQRVAPRLDRDFGETVAVMLTISSPPVSDVEVEQRAAGIARVLTAHRAGRPEAHRDGRMSGVVVHPTTLDPKYIQWLGTSLLKRLTEEGLARDGAYVAAPGAGCVDFQLVAGVDDDRLRAAVVSWETEVVGTGMSHPDLWPGVLVRDLGTIADALRSHPHVPNRSLDRYSYRDLRRFADQIQDRLKQSPNVGKVEQIGVQEEAIDLFYSDRRLASLGISPAEVARRLQERNTNLPGGTIELPGQEVAIRPSGEFRFEAEVGQVVVSERGGYPLYLRDLVDVVRGYQDPPAAMNYQTVKADPKAGDKARSQHARAITLAIRQVKGVQVAAFSRDIDRVLDSLSGILPSDLRVERTSNEPAMVRAKIAQFDGNVIEAVLIVVVVALAFMEWRSALLVAASIPLTIAMTLGLCQLAGIDLQQISIAALIIALGLLVDDPVVAGDAINRELAEGTARDVAAWLGPQKLARAILYATLTNCVAFLPLLLVEGKSGDFIYSLPIVVTASLVSSRIVSMTFVPLLGYYILRGQRGYESSLDAQGRAAAFARAYNGFSEWFMDRRWASLAFCLVLLLAASALLPMIPTAFFPKDRHTVFTVNLTLPEGSPIRQTRDVALRVVDEIDAIAGEEARAYTTFVGAGGPRFWLSVVPEQRTDNYAQILVHTAEAETTETLVGRLKRALPPRVAAGRITIEQLETGPPIGVPVQIRLTGGDIEELRRLGEATKDLLRQVPGSENIHDDWGPEVFQLGLDVRPDKANLAGITHQDLAAMVHAGLSGHVTTQLVEADRRIPITLRLRSDERVRLASLASLNAYAGSSLARVPLAQLAEIRPELVAPAIRRRNHERCLTVKCDTVPGVLPSQVVKAMDQPLAKASTAWAPGYRFEFGGEKEEQAKGFASVAIALVVSLVAIYLTLVLQFNSVTKPLVVFAAVPFGLVGGLMGLIVFRAPFGFMAFLGVASLAGVIVSHIIVLFDYIEEMHERGEPLRRAVIDAALVRLRPVLVTVLATVGGLIPLAIEGGPLWQPMCYVQIVGLLVATLVTKIVVPVLYVIFVEDLGWIRWETTTAGPPHLHAGQASLAHGSAPPALAHGVAP